MTREAVPVATAVGAVLIWSTNALAGGAALERLTVVQVLALQFGGAFAVVAIARVAGPPDHGPRPGARAATVAALGAVGIAGTLGLQYIAFALAPLLAANAIAYAWPLMVAAVAALAGGGPKPRAPLALALAGFVGVILVFAQRGGGGGAGGGGAAAPAPLVGYVAALGSATAMAAYTLAAGRIAAGTRDLLLAGTGCGAVVAVPLAVAEGGAWTPGWAVALGLFVGVGPVGLGYALWTRAMADPRGPRLAPIAYATPLLSTLLLVLAGDRLAPLGMLGCGLIVLSAAGVVAGARLPAPATSYPSRKPRTSDA